jgi:hypothetical protein
MLEKYKTKLKAIYKPDLAFDGLAIIFEYNKDKNQFIMVDDKDYCYDVDALVEDEDWLIFKTCLHSDGEHDCGETAIIYNKDILKYIEQLK